MSICCVSDPIGHTTDASLSSCGGKVTCVRLSCRMLTHVSFILPPCSTENNSQFKQRDKNNSDERSALSFLEPPHHHGDILYLHLSICLPWPASFSFLPSSAAPRLFLYLRSTVRSIRLMKRPAHSSRPCPGSHLISNLAAPVIHHSAPSVSVLQLHVLCVSAAESGPKGWTTKSLFLKGG